MKTFNKKELAANNGKEGSFIFIAYNGNVYNVSNSFLWKKGTHQALHKAGADLTNELALAPHGEDLLERFPVVGTLQGSENAWKNRIIQ